METIIKHRLVGRSLGRIAVSAVVIVVIPCGEFIFLIKVMLVVFIPSILTFLQPDTGVVLIYLLITTIMLFIGGANNYGSFSMGFIFALIGFFLPDIYLHISNESKKTPRL